ncbi:phage portal protein [Rhizobium sullae]|uniref:Phage portal protein n=1 Tax=Rhizobium sullae TaxID=50338 RepID=A0ABY5XN19_RHISU|nr:phage portal protein [Rhizobium sullae]UWU16007.1 phage portal protein [Rhizobium sullae]
MAKTVYERISGLFFGKSETRATDVSDPLVASILGYAPTASAALNMSTASRCISLITGAFASADVTLYRQAADGSPEPAVGHALYDLMLNGTADMSAYELKSALMESLASYGEAFAKVSFDNQGRLTSLDPLEWQNVSVENLGNGRLQYRVVDLLRNNAVTVHSSNDIFHAKWRPKNLRGRSPLALAALSMGIASDFENAVATDARSGFKAGGILTAPGAIANDTAKRLKATFESGYMGAAGTGKIAVLGDGLKFDRMALSNADNEVLENRRLNAYLVAQAYGVPPDVAGLPFHSTWSSASEANRQFVNLAAEVWSQCLCQQLCAFVLGSRERKTLYLAAKWDLLISGSLQERSAAYNSLTSAGIMTLNEARQTMDLKPLENGNQLRVPLNTAPAKEPVA